MADKAFVKGLKLLSALSESGGPRTLTSLADQLGLTKSNTHRLLHTLIEEGFVKQDGEKGLYSATLRLWEMGSRIVADLDLMGIARTPMQELSDKVGETIHLSVLDGLEVIYVDKIEATQAVRAYTNIGARAPAWAVATGKAMLAHIPAAEEALIASARRKRFSPKTLVTKDSLRAEFARIRETGIAFNNGEWRPDVCGAASPIRDARGSVIAALGISGPAIRLNAERLQGLAPAVISGALTMSRALGWQGQD